MNTKRRSKVIKGVEHWECCRCKKMLPRHVYRTTKYNKRPWPYCRPCENINSRRYKKAAQQEYGSPLAAVSNAYCDAIENMHRVADERGISFRDAMTQAIAMWIEYGKPDPESANANYQGRSVQVLSRGRSGPDGLLLALQDPA